MKGKRIGKVIAFLLLLTLAVSGVTGKPTGATIDAGKDVQIDYINETMTVTTTQDSVIYFTDTYYADISRWEQCEVRNGKAVFDISWVSDHKTVRLYLCGDVQNTIVSKDVTWKEELKVDFVGKEE